MRRLEWRDIVGYEGMYQVSNYGGVRSVDREVPHKTSGVLKLKGRDLKLSTGPHGHHFVKLYRNGKTDTRYVHHLVAFAFLGACPTGMLVKHGPRGAQNDSTDNLSYGTQSENMFDKYRDATMVCTPVKRSDGKVFRSQQEAARETGVNQSKISLACNGKRKTAGGYAWEIMKDTELV